MIGANIGAGLVLLIVLPVAALLLLGAATMAFLLRPKPELRPGPAG